MPVARLVAVVFVLSSALAFAQDEQGHPYTDAFAPPYSLSFFESLHHLNPSGTIPSEPRTILPSQPQLADPALITPDATNHFQADFYQMDPSVGMGLPFSIATTYDSPVNDSSVNDSSKKEQDTVCYAIRSYVVARDNKHSDSTHPVSQSNCQPATRYSLRSADLQPRSQDR